MFNFKKPSAATQVKAFGAAQVLTAAASHKLNDHLAVPGAKLAAQALGALTHAANTGYRKAVSQL